MQLVVFGALLLASCVKGSASEAKPCPRRGPTFRVAIAAGGAELPADTEITVAYGSNTERFDLTKGNGRNQDVCCAARDTESSDLRSVPCEEPRDAAFPSDVVSIECELSTNGAALLSVRASGYGGLEETLEAERLEGDEWEHCDALVTRELSFSLLRGDAGL